MGEKTLTRCRFLEGAAALGAAGIAASWEARVARATTLAKRPRRSLETIVVCSQENRSFDHYFGFAPFAGRYGVPAGWSQPDGSGGQVAPYHLTTPSTPDQSHTWSAMHSEWNRGRMDGFYTTDGMTALGYYDAADLPYYYSLFEQFTLCANYFCSAMTMTYPNRYYQVAGTSGGITTNGVYGTGIFNYPIILDLLESKGISWKVYDLDQAPVESGFSDNVFLFWARFANDPRTKATLVDYLNDAQLGTLPQVSFIIPGDATGMDEHPPSPVTYGMSLQQRLIGALMSSPQWPRAAYVLTYDESGGFFDHVAPPQLDAFGLGFRVPTWIVSPLAKRSYLAPPLYEHTSILKLIQRVFGLPTLASVNHRFDRGTPGGSDYEASNGASSGPPAPPRDRLKAVGDLTDCFAV